MAVEGAVGDAEAEVEGVGEEEGPANGGGHSLTPDAIRYLHGEVEQEVSAVGAEVGNDVPQANLPLHLVSKLKENQLRLGCVIRGQIRAPLARYLVSVT